MRRSVLILRIAFWCLAAMVAVFIFVHSSQTAAESTAVSSSFSNEMFSTFWSDYSELTDKEQSAFIRNSQFIVRKSAHFAVYCALGFCICGALKTYNFKNLTVMLLSWGGATVYAVSDEIHQLFVEGRAGRVYDVLLDSFGAAVGVLLLTLFACLYVILKRRKRNVR